LVKLQNIYDLKFDEKQIESLPLVIDKIKQFLNSEKLITKTKAEEFYNKLQESLFVIISYAVKIFFIVYDAIENKKQLQKIMDSENMLAEYQAQAKLLNVAGEDYIEKLLNRLNFLLKQIEFFSKEWSQNL